MNEPISHIVNAKTILNKYRRNSISSSIKLFELSDFISHEKELLKSLSESHESLHYDYYDVANKIEKEIINLSKDVYENNENEWLDIWSTIKSEENDKKRIINFWESKFKEREDLSFLKKIEPHRKRSCFQYIVSPTNNKHEWNILEYGSPIFKQNVSGSRSRVRNFKIPVIEIKRNKQILDLIGAIAQALIFNPSVTSTKFKFTMHQMFTYAKGQGFNEPAPEGIHQDGVPFIISAIVIERVNVIGGISRIYYNKPKNRNDKSRIAFEHELKIGEGIMQADKHNSYWHDISPILKKDKDKIGYRAILGFDIEFI